MDLFGLSEVRAELEAILGAPVDLVPATDLKPEMQKRALQDAIAL